MQSVTPIYEFRIIDRLPLRLVTLSIERTIGIFAACPAPATPKMRTSQLSVLPILGLLPASTVADFVIGKYSGQQLGGTFQTPGQLGVTGTWISTSKSDRYHRPNTQQHGSPSYHLEPSSLTTSFPQISPAKIPASQPPTSATQALRRTPASTNGRTGPTMTSAT